MSSSGSCNRDSTLPTGMRWHWSNHVGIPRDTMRPAREGLSPQPSSKGNFMSSTADMARGSVKAYPADSPWPEVWALPSLGPERSAAS